MKKIHSYIIKEIIFPCVELKFLRLFTLPWSCPEYMHKTLPEYYSIPNSTQSLKCSVSKRSSTGSSDKSGCSMKQSHPIAQVQYHVKISFFSFPRQLFTLESLSIGCSSPTSTICSLLCMVLQLQFLKNYC